MSFERIFNSPLITDNILMWMDLYDVYKVRMLCKSLKYAADAEIKRRRLTPQVDCITIGYPRDKKRSSIDTLNLFKEKFELWKKSWYAPPTVLLVSPSFTFEFEMEDTWVPHDCTCVVIEGDPVCVDGIHIDTEGDNQYNFETCNLTALHSLNNVSVLSSNIGDDTKGFFEVLDKTLADPILKFIIVFAHYEELESLIEKSDKALDIASKRGVVTSCYASEGCPRVLNFHGRGNADCTYAAVCFSGANTSAASVFVDAGRTGGVAELVNDWKTVDSARRRFVKDCDKHEMSVFGFCDKCNTQTLGFFMAPPHYHNFGYEEDDDDPLPLCFNQEQDAFRYVIPNVPLIGWLGDLFIAGRNVNADADEMETRILHPKDDANFVHAVLILR